MTRLALILTLLAGPVLLSQPLTETIEVRVVNVDVVVTDRTGNAVTGLTPADFEILEDGKAQAITNFFEVRDGSALAHSGSAAPESAPARRIVFMVDVHSLHPHNRTRLATALRSFVAKQIAPGDLVSIVMWNGAVAVLAPPTTDRALLSAAIDTIEKTGSISALKSELVRVQSYCTRSLELARNGRMPFKVAYADCISRAREQSLVTVLQSRQLLSAVELITTTIAGNEGKKIVVLAGAVLPRTPGTEIFQWANQLFRPFLRGFDAPMARPDFDDEQSAFLERAASAANANGVTLYTIAATVAADPSGSDQRHAVDEQWADFLNQANTFGSYETLARLTGGVAVKRPSDFETAFAAIGRDLGSYYSLGFRPRVTASRERALVVRARNRDYTVRARQNHTYKTADDVMSDRVVANIFVPAAPGDWKSALRVGSTRRSDANFAVPIEIVVAPDLTLLPSGPTLAGGFKVFVAVGTPEGALSTVFRQPEQVRIPPAEEKAFRAEPLIFPATLTVRPGENIISVGVVDQVSGATTFARTVVMAQ